MKSGTRVLVWELLVLGAACCFAMAATLARMSYDTGSNALTVVAARTLFTAGALAALLKTEGAPLAPPAEERSGVLVMALLLVVQSYALYGAYQYMPIGLALILFYTYPILTLLASAALERRRLGVGETLPPLLALAGLVLALAPAGGEWRALGPLHAVVAAIGFSAMLVYSARRFSTSASRQRTFLMFSIASPAFLAAGGLFDAFAFPHGVRGWTAFAVVPILYSVGITLTWAAVARIGPVRVATFLNIEPVAGIVFSYFLLGQQLSVRQLAGAALVIAALFAAARARMHAARSP